MRTRLNLSWMTALVAILAAYYLALGGVVGGVIGLVGIVGAFLITSVLAVRSRSRLVAVIFLTAGAVPFGVLLWWSVIAPVLALVTLIIGGAFIAQRSGATSLATQ